MQRTEDSYRIKGIQMTTDPGNNSMGYPASLLVAVLKGEQWQKRPNVCSLH